MKANASLLLNAAIGGLMLALASPVSGAEETKPTGATDVIWQNDPLCQFVFFAVLEGLYRDGVPNEAVDLIIGAPIKEEGNKVKRVFVFRCELCHATYEAFRAYRSRPVFQNTKGQSGFAKPKIDAEFMKELGSDDARTRVYAMGRLVRPWILQRIEETRKTEEEKAAMKKEFERYAREGEKHLRKYFDEKDPFYLDWMFYGQCQACEAAEDLGK